MSSPIFLVAAQRSGTTVFQNTLGEGSVCAAFGEVFHENKQTYSLNFFNFLESNAQAAKLYQYKTSENTKLLFSLYMDFLSSATEKDFHFIDVKENSLHHFDAIWRDVFACPEFLKLAMERNFPVVRIKRKNLFLQVLSQDVSTKIKQWHFKHSEIVPKVTFSIDCSEYAGRMERFEREGAFIDNCLKDYHMKVDLYYENLFENGFIAKHAVDRLEAVIGVPLDAGNALVFQKTVVNPATYIENIEEVKQYFNNAPYSDMIIEGLSING